MADYSYLPLGWTCQQLLNNATQNLGYDMHAPTFPGHPSVLPLKGEADHMHAGGPTGSVGGPILNSQLREDPTAEEMSPAKVPAKKAGAK